MKGELYINGKDAYLTWGISMDDTSLSELMTPPANKAYRKRKSLAAWQASDCSKPEVGPKRTDLANQSDCPYRRTVLCKV